MSVQPKFRPTVKSEFSRVLRERVNGYFKEKGISTHANTEMVVKTIVLIIAWFGTYGLLVFGNVPLWASYVLWAVLGAVIALVSMNIGHDAIHGAYSKKKWVKTLLSHTFNINGASAYMWKISHNHAHHTFTNIHGHDEDISPGDILRISPSTKLLPMHRFQQFYAFFFYGLATLSWVLMKDYKQFFENRINNYDNHKHPAREYFLLFFYKLINYGLYIAIPIIFMPYTVGQIVLGYLLFHLVCGMYLALMFMLAHAVEEVHFPLPDDEGIIGDDWVVHQMHTTANFSSSSWWAGFLSGGLNTQIEHHLFANVCSVHYRSLSKVIKATCEEYGVPYHDLPSFGAALKSHFNFLKRMGREADYRPKTQRQTPAEVKLAHA